MWSVGAGDVAQETATIWRVYSIDDGTTRMEPIEVALDEARNGAQSKLLDGPGVMIRRVAPGITSTWHNAPRRQLIATVSGECEVETGDGQKLRVCPGVLLLVEDVEGVGHLTRTPTAEGWLCLFVPLDDATVLT